MKKFEARPLRAAKLEIFKSELIIGYYFMYQRGRIVLFIR